MKWTAWIDESEENIRLIDWGESFAFDSPPRRLAQPADWRVPETIFTSQIDYRVDLWRAGIVVWKKKFNFAVFIKYMANSTVDLLYDFCP